MKNDLKRIIIIASVVALGAFIAQSPNATGQATEPRLANVVCMKKDASALEGTRDLHASTGWGGNTNYQLVRKAKGNHVCYVKVHPSKIRCMSKSQKLSREELHEGNFFRKPVESAYSPNVHCYLHNDVKHLKTDGKKVEAYGGKVVESCAQATNQLGRALR